MLYPKRLMLATLAGLLVVIGGALASSPAFADDPVADATIVTMENPGTGEVDHATKALIGQAGSDPAIRRANISFTHVMSDVGGFCEEGSDRFSYCGCAFNYTFTLGYHIVYEDPASADVLVIFDDPVEGDITTSGGRYISCHNLMGFDDFPGIVGSEILRNVHTFTAWGLDPD